MRGESSAPTGRVLDVLELLARSGADPIRFTDVVRELGITQATAHAILKTLTDRGWVSRDPMTKTFSLGPALALVAARLHDARPLAHAAQAAAAELSKATGYAASVVEQVEDALIITAFEAGADVRTPGAPGDRIPYSPPFGVAFAAWAAADEQRAWIERGGALSPTLTRRLGDLLARTRERGYDVDWTTPALTRAARAIGTVPSSGLPRQIRQLLDELLAEFTSVGLLAEEHPAHAAQPVATIAAPVFTQSGRVALIVAVHPLCGLTTSEVVAIGERLTEVTGAIGGAV